MVARSFRAQKPVLSAEEKAKYLEIYSAVKAKAGDGAKNVSRRDAATASAAKDAAEVVDVKGEDYNTKDADFVGIVLGGYGGSLAVADGELDMNTDDIYIEEPRVVAEDDDDENADERSLWGDGDDDPAEEA
eukprot:TRINITY_DN155_c0_g1_i1.p1 TRINITY_DN155_c0_g1~~TRINITY_DN155_c0_g1_i1.p1  ORF type:complete len:132 (+),score=51.39 TRINITY_DN155_c0_g1_i1:83-478(+)